MAERNEKEFLKHLISARNTYKDYAVYFHMREVDERENRSFDGLCIEFEQNPSTE